MPDDDQKARELARLLLAPPSREATQMLQGVVSTLQANNRLAVYLSGATTAVGGLRYLDSFVPEVGDVVWIAKTGPDLIVIGRLRDPSDTEGVWIDWDPVTTNLTEGSSLADAAYMVKDKTCFFTWSWSFGSGGAVTGTVSMELPFTPLYRGACAATARDASAFGIGYSCTLEWLAGDPTATFLTNGQYLGTTTPFTWATTDTLATTGFFPIDA